MEHKFTQTRYGVQICHVSLFLLYLCVFSQHQAAVKGMAWCPWQSRLLATGGGTSDRTVRIWNMNTGECSYSVDTKSQVSGIFWNSEYSEIITSHGIPNHTLQIWKYPTMNLVRSRIFSLLCNLVINVSMTDTALDELYFFTLVPNFV